MQHLTTIFYVTKLYSLVYFAGTEYLAECEQDHKSRTTFVF